MRSISLLSATIFWIALALAQTAKPLSAFEQQLIDQQKQFLQASLTKPIRRSTAPSPTIFRASKPMATSTAKASSSSPLEGGMPKDTRAYDFHVVKLNDDVRRRRLQPDRPRRPIHAIATWPTPGRKSTANGN